jgi:electron transfer flavoprotein alpha subunit
MSKILIVAEHSGGKLNQATAKCVACASKISGAEIDVAVLATDASAVAAQAATLQGVTKVLKVENAANAEPLAAILAPQVAAVAANYTHVFGPSTTFGKDLMPRVAALLGVGQLSDIMAVESAYLFRRPIYAGNAIVTVEAAKDRKIVATVRVASFQPVAEGGSAAVETASVNAELPAHTRFDQLTKDVRERLVQRARLKFVNAVR